MLVSRGARVKLPVGINCAGEIRVGENEDYEKWAIEIFVKFREGEPLTQLTGQRQSGGVSKDVHSWLNKPLTHSCRSDH
jgi:hypothetical protein